MARSSSSIKTIVWADPEWRALTADQQWLYMTVLSQPDLSWCGVLTWSGGRLARCAEGMTKARVERARQGLVAARFLVVDDETDEVWVRTFLKWEKVLVKPNILVAASHDLAQVHSHTIREGLVEQFREGFPEGLAERFDKPLRQRFAQGFLELFPERFREPFPEPPLDHGPRSRKRDNYPPPHNTVVASPVEEEEDEPSTTDPAVAAVARAVAERRLARRRGPALASPQQWLAKVGSTTLADSRAIIEAMLADGMSHAEVVEALDPTPPEPGVERRDCCGASTVTPHMVGCSKASDPVWGEDEHGRAVRMAG